ncbi:uncharacterized protein LOC119832403 [Zerene cesonia]|uniref:uncharacterized protein LOC119832403 n=1 Tax=Zerene cesonia TaxID=33412 RepID=UPI0018E506CB|nr:uncharacterized protein LOC119832403 [Zerene cesonia]
MAKSFVIHVCLILLTFCPGKGNRRKKIIDNYKRDFSLQKRIFDWDNQEIYAYSEYYNEYPNYSEIDYDYGTSNHNKRDFKDKLKWDSNGRKNEKSFIHNIPKKGDAHNKFLDIPLQNKTKNTNIVLSISSEKWPTFEDILLAMGKKYDWKNDRWIKVKKKTKDTIQLGHKNVNKSINFHEKHRFIYRIVRLNRPKSKRNIILAVTAVR